MYLSGAERKVPVCGVVEYFTKSQLHKGLQKNYCKYGERSEKNYLKNWPIWKSILRFRTRVKEFTGLIITRTNQEIISFW
jgi:hypothetical protein